MLLCSVPADFHFILLLLPPLPLHLLIIEKYLCSGAEAVVAAAADQKTLFQVKKIACPVIRSRLSSVSGKAVSLNKLFRLCFLHNS